MTKSKTKSEVEHLRGVVKELKKEIRRKEKREHRYLDLEDKEAEALLRETEEYKTIIVKETCPHCKGELQCTEIGLVKLITCKDCKYRSSKRKT